MLQKQNFLTIFLLLNISATLANKNWKSLFIDIDNSNDTALARCTLNIMRKNFVCGSVLNVVYSSSDIDTLVATINRDKCYTIVVRSFQERDWFIENGHYILIAKNITDFTIGMSHLRLDLFWNPRARFIIHIPDIDRRELFTILIQYKIYDVVFIKNEDKTALLYTYFPFANGNCGRNFDDVVKIGDCGDDTDVAKSFPNKFLNGLRNCTVSVTMTEDVPNVIYKSHNITFEGKPLDGVEQLILNTVASLKGFSLNYQYLNKDQKLGVVLSNGTAIGVLGYLQRGETDIVGGGFVMIKNRITHFDYFWGWFYGNFYMFTATSPNNEWKLFYQEFGTETWLLILFFYCLVALVYATFYKLTSKPKPDHVSLMLELWGYFYSNASQNLPKEKKLRLILTCWILFTFFINNFYNTAFYSLITEQSNTKRTVQFDHLENLPFKPCINNAVRTFFNVTMNKTWPENQYSSCWYTLYALDTVAANKDLFAIDVAYPYTTNEFRYMDDEGNRKLELWAFPNTFTVNTMYLSRGFPLRDTFQKYTGYMYEAGLIKHRLNLIKLQTQKAVYEKGRKHKNLSVGSFSIPFFLLFIGSCFSFISFLLEVAMKK